MNQRQHKEVIRPGENQKRYIAGAMNTHTDQLTMVEGHRKNSVLLIMLLNASVEQQSDSKRIHIDV